jgi:hypothetical protein
VLASFGVAGLSEDQQSSLLCIACSTRTRSQQFSQCNQSVQMKEQQGCSIHAVDSFDSAASFGVAGLSEDQQSI